MEESIQAKESFQMKLRECLKVVSDGYKEEGKGNRPQKSGMLS